MFLSIIIPTYNDEKYLAECLDSCLHQDIPYDNYEIICVDDGSTDRTPEILRKYESKYPNIHLVFKEHGVGNGRTIGFHKAVGDFIWFVDHDDIVAPDAVPELKDAVRANPDCDRIQFPYYQFYGNLSEKELHLMESGHLLPNDNDRYRDMVVWDSIYKASFLREHGIEPRIIEIDQAGEFWGIPKFRVFAGDTIFVQECLNQGIQTTFIEGRPLYHYRRHAQTETMDYSPEKVKWREELKYHSSLLYLYCAIKNKEIYQNQRKKNGAADEDVAIRAIVSLRKAASSLAYQPNEYWRKGMALANEKDVFFPKKVPEYKYSYQQYLKSQPFAERLKLRTSAQYYTYTKLGTRLFRLLTTVGRIRNDMMVWEKAKNNFRKLEYSLKKLRT